MSGHKIDVDVRRDIPGCEGIILFKPITGEGHAWFRDNVSPETPLYNGAFVCEGNEMIDYVFDGLMDEGLVAL